MSVLYDLPGIVMLTRRFSAVTGQAVRGGSGAHHPSAAVTAVVPREARINKLTSIMSAVQFVTWNST